MESTEKKRNIAGWFIDVARGVGIGVANIIPGVSGGTIGVMLGIYDKMMAAISNLKKSFKKNFLYLLPILLGMGIGIAAFSKLLEMLLDKFPMQTNFFFLGLVLGSIPLILRHSGIKFKGVQAGEFTLKTVLPFVIACAFIVLLTVFFGGTKADTDRAGALAGFSLTPVTGVVLVCAGAIAAIAMELPGISGSMMMVVMGYYAIILGAVSGLVDTLKGLLSGNGLVFANNCLPVLVLFGIGVVLGLFFGAKLITLCINKARTVTYSAILGLVIGSLYQVYVGSGFTFDINGVFAVIALVIGGAIALVFGSPKLSVKQE